MKTPFGLTARSDSIVSPAELIRVDKLLREGVDFEAMIVRQVASLRQGDHPGTERIDWQKVTREGAAKIFNVGGADNIPLVDLHTAPYSHRVVSLVIGFVVNSQERRAADMAGRDVVGQKVLTSQRYLTVKENEIGFFGAAPNGIEGLLAYTGTQTYTVPLNGGGTSRHWDDKTGAEILNDLMQSWAKVALKDNYRASIAIFNTTDMVYLQQPYAATTPESVLEIAQRRGYFPGGILMSEKIPSGTFVVMQNTPDVLELAVPMDVYQYPPFQLNSMTVEMDFEERFAGFIVYRPLGICIVSGFMP